jgi:hypothetical protein
MNPKLEKFCQFLTPVTDERARAIQGGCMSGNTVGTADPGSVLDRLNQAREGARDNGTESSEYFLDKCGAEAGDYFEPTAQAPDWERKQYDHDYGKTYGARAFRCKN